MPGVRSKLRTYTAVEYHLDGSKHETTYVNGKLHGKEVVSHEDGRKAEIIWENGKLISKKEWDRDGNQTYPKP